MNLDDAVAWVRPFHEHIGAPVADKPRLLTGVAGNAARLGTQLLELSLVASNLGAVTEDLLLLRLGMALEEVSQWLLAHARGDLVVAADAWADRLYVLLGDARRRTQPGDHHVRTLHL